MKISVIIPCFNEEKTIHKILELVQISLNNNDYEIILVDDGSTDNTSQIIHDLSLKEDTNVVISHEINLGKGAALR